MSTFIVGGTSGLGRELAALLTEKSFSVYCTGRSNNVLEEVEKLPRLDLLVYAAGFYEQGRIDELSDEHIREMLNVGLGIPALLLQRILKKQGDLDGFIAITSTSQWIPREKEPVYAAVKAGLAMFANSVSLDPRVKKTLVVGPTGMQSNFWAGTGKDMIGMLQPSFVAREIMQLWDDSYAYRLARILRDPSRVEVLETRAAS